MTLFGVIRCTALKALQPTNRSVLPTLTASRLLANQSEKISDLKNKFPEKPKRPQSAYNVFYKELSAKLRNENPNLKIQDLAKNIGHLWNNLDSVEKQKLVDQKKSEQDQYKQLVDKWKRSLTDQQRDSYTITLRSRKQVLARRRLKSELKKLDHPIRSKTAFNFFLQEKLKGKGKTDEPYVTVFRQMAAQWKSMNTLEKEPYVQLSDADKVRYVRELDQWNKKMEKEDNTKQIVDKLAKLRTVSSRSYLVLDKDKKKKRTAKAKPKKITLRASKKGVIAKKGKKSLAKGAKAKTAKKSVRKATKSKPESKSKPKRESSDSDSN